jgi:hypothetical protein
MISIRVTGRNSFLSIVGLVCLSLTYSCKQATIPEKDMVPIISEMFITDAVVSAADFSMKFVKRDTIEYYKPIYTKYGYSDNQFYKTIDFYINNPNKLDGIMDKVINHLSKLEAMKTAEVSKARDEVERKREEKIFNSTRYKLQYILLIDEIRDTIIQVNPLIFTPQDEVLIYSAIFCENNQTLTIDPEIMNFEKPQEQPAEITKTDKYPNKRTAVKPGPKKDRINPE